MLTNVHARAHTSMHVCRDAGNIHTDTHMHTHAHAHVHTHARTHARARARAHTHTHTTIRSINELICLMNLLFCPMVKSLMLAVVESEVGRWGMWLLSYSPIL